MDTNQLRIAFVGDVCLSFLKATPTTVHELKSWSTIKREIGTHDFLVGNLECCIVDDRCSLDVQSLTMATPISAGTFLHELGFSVMSLANNHSLDCGPGGLAATRECLANHNIRTFGAGYDLHKAEEPIFVQCNGYTIAFIGACDKSELYASDNRAGIAPLEKRRLGQLVGYAAANADLVVTMLHADLEFSDVPGRWRQRLSRWLVEQGSHLVIQHHPHVLQGIEEHQGGLIAYSLGNFIFPLRGNRYQEHQDGVFNSMVMVVDIDMSGKKPLLEHRAIPLQIGSDHLPHLMTDPIRRNASERLQLLSSKVAESSVHRKLWFRRCRLEAINRMSDIYYAFRRRELSRAIRTLHQLLTCREDRRWMRGLVTLGYL